MENISFDLLAQTFGSIRQESDLIATAAKINSVMDRVRNGIRVSLIDLREVDLVNPELVVVLVALMRWLDTYFPDGTGGLIGPTDQNADIAFGEFDFWQRYTEGVISTSKIDKAKYEQVWEASENANTIPVEHFVVSNPYTISSIANYFATHVPNMSDKIGRLEGTFDELMGNVVSHSDSPIGGVIAGHFDSAAKAIRFSICDFGISIPGHLSSLNSHAKFSDDILLIESFKVGVTAGDLKKHSGQGLPFVKELTIDLNGEISVYSRNGLYVLSEKLERSHFVNVPFPGTIVSNSWPVQ